MSNPEGQLPRNEPFPTCRFEPGTPVTVAVADGPLRGDYDLELEYADRKTLYLSLPMRARQPICLPPGTPVRLGFARPKAGDSPELNSWVVAAPPEAGPCLAVSLPSELTSRQRREHVRFPTDLAVTVSRSVGPEDPEGASARHFPAFAEDISMGGMAVRCPWGRFTVGDTVRILLVLPHSAPVAASGRIARVLDGGRLVGIHFTEIPSAGRRQLAGFVADQERSRRATELSLRMLGVEGDEAEDPRLSGKRGPYQAGQGLTPHRPAD